MHNILILSCGTRNKIVQYFRKELKNRGIVIATDCSSLAPALYDADKYYVVPRIEEENYLDVILDLCREDGVKGILSLIDPELTLISKNFAKFIDIGTLPIVSNPDLIELSFNKYMMYSFLIDKGFDTVRSYVDKKIFYDDLKNGIIDFPVFIKPIKGSASININVANSAEQLEFLFSSTNDLMIQEYVKGQEFGVDVYVDLISKKVVSVFIKEKLLMRAGETDKSLSVINKELTDIIISFVEQAGFVGVLDIDVFFSNGKYLISEVNPRFGGGFPHAYESNVNIPRMIINNLQGIANEKSIGNYKVGTTMLKYNEIKILENPNK